MSTHMGTSDAPQSLGVESPLSAAWRARASCGSSARMLERRTREGRGSDDSIRRSSPSRILESPWMTSTYISLLGNVRYDNGKIMFSAEELGRSVACMRVAALARDAVPSGTCVNTGSVPLCGHICMHAFARSCGRIGDAYAYVLVAPSWRLEVPR